MVHVRPAVLGPRLPPPDRVGELGVRLDRDALCGAAPELCAGHLARRRVARARRVPARVGVGARGAHLRPGGACVPRPAARRAQHARARRGAVHGAAAARAAARRPRPLPVQQRDARTEHAELCAALLQAAERARQCRRRRARRRWRAAPAARLAQPADQLRVRAGGRVLLAESVLQADGAVLCARRVCHHARAVRRADAHGAPRARRVAARRPRGGDHGGVPRGVPAVGAGRAQPAAVPRAHLPAGARPVRGQGSECVVRARHAPRRAVQGAPRAERRGARQAEPRRDARGAAAGVRAAVPRVGRDRAPRVDPRRRAGRAGRRARAPAQRHVGRVGARRSVAARTQRARVGRRAERRSVRARVEPRL